MASRSRCLARAAPSSAKTTSRAAAPWSGPTATAPTRASAWLIIDDNSYFEGWEDFGGELSAAHDAAIIDGFLTLNLGDNDLDSTPPSANFSIPPGQTALLKSTQMTVSGRAWDNVALASVRVNGIEATSTDGFNTWTADLSSLGWGEHALSLEVTDQAGLTFLAEGTGFKTGILAYGIKLAAYNTYNDQLLLHSSEYDMYVMEATDGRVTRVGRNTRYPLRMIPIPGSNAA
ncbi:MAG: hypothetical protein V7629_09375 [Motiliproteus sp.]